MSTPSEGATYAPQPKPAPVVGPGEFHFAAVRLNHGHIYGMTEGLISAGATCTWVYDDDAGRLAAFTDRFPQVQVASSEAEILADPQVRLVASAGITSERAPFGIEVMEAGKDFFVDKAPLTTLDQLAAVRAAVERTGRKYAVYYSERVHVSAAVLAEDLIAQDAIGRVIQVMSMGPHRVGDPASRPDWFFEKEKYGGILCDIGSHNFDQILAFTGATDATITRASIANYGHPEHPGLDDFGDAHVVTDNGASGYVRVDWFTPDGLRTWGDGRTFILGTEGYIELRKYVDVAVDVEGPARGGHVFLVNAAGEQHFEADELVGYPFFGRLIRDCIDRTETAMTQAHALKAAELSVLAQLQARVLESSDSR